MAMQATTIAEMFESTCRRFEHQPQKIAYAEKAGEQWKPITHDELKVAVEDAACSFYDLGIQPGDRIGIVSENRLEWIITDFACAISGIVDVPVFPTLTAEQLAFIFQDCTIRIVFVSNAFQAEKVCSVLHHIPSCTHVVVMESHSEFNHPAVLSYATFLQRGRTYPKDMRATILDAAQQQVTPDTLLTIIYTSGTTGNPKGVMLSHHNLIQNIIAATIAFPVSDTDVFLSYLPTCHSYERMSGYYLAFAVGASTYISESIDAVAKNMLEVQPTIMTSVPRLFERMKNRIESTIATSAPLQQHVVAWAFGIRARHIRNPSRFALGNWIADTLVMKNIRARTGGKIRFFASGGASLPTHIAEFFDCVGLQILEGYGLTETSPVLTANTLTKRKIGTVGKPLSNVELRFGADGEIYARGPNVMQGYWNNSKATDDVVDSDGWLATGDIGHLDDDGFLVITDRKKNIIVSSGGKNIAPAKVESALSESEFVESLAVFGDNKDFITAVIVVHEHTVRLWAIEQGLPTHDYGTLVLSDALYKAVMDDLNKAQQHLSKYERVRRFVIADEPFSVHNGQLTPTMKVRRKNVYERYKSRIEQLYVLRAEP
jgi:long-chain acyl-CoA synthetase